MNGFLDDLRTETRLLLRHWRTTAAVVLMLVMSVAVAITAFSGFSAMTFRALPFSSPDELVYVGETWGKRWSQMPRYPTFRAWQRENRAFVSMAAATYGRSGLADEDRVHALLTHRVSPGFFATLGVTVAGREFAEADNRYGDASSVLVSDELARRLFDDVRSALGKRIVVDAVPQEIIGVVPRGFRIFNFQPAVDLFLPIGRFLVEEAACDSCGDAFVVGRLRPGVTRHAASADLNAISRSVYGVEVTRTERYRVAVRELREAVYYWERQVVRFVLEAALLAVLLASVNASNLVLVQSLARAGEMAVRSALGASPWRLVRSMAIQGLLYGLGASALGLVAGILGCRLMVVLLPDPRWLTSGGWTPTVGVVVFGLLTSAVGGLGATSIAALTVTRTRITDGLTRGMSVRLGPVGALRLSRWMVGIQVGVAVLLSIEAWSVIESAHQMLHASRGVDVDPVMTVRIEHHGSVARDRRPEEFEREVLERLSAVPGVVSAASTREFPTLERPERAEVTLLSNGGWSPSKAVVHRVSGGYRRTLGIPLLRGSWLDPAFADGIVVNLSLAERLGDDVLGRSLLIRERRGQTRTGRIVGVVSDTWAEPNRPDPVPEVYLPTDFTWGGYSLLLRTRTDALSVARSVRALVRDVDPQAAVDIRPLKDRIVQAGAETQSLALVMGVVGAFVLGLLVSGVYTNVAAAAAWKTRDVGIRIALGACGGRVWIPVLRSLMTITMVGIVLGLFAAFVLDPAVTGLTATIETRDGWTYLGVACVVVVSAIAGASAPVRRVLRTSPAAVLNAE